MIMAASAGPVLAGTAARADQETWRTKARQDERSQQHPAPGNG
jgi:hypothetical protein